jgi:RNA-directed DNA polymerase
MKTSTEEDTTLLRIQECDSERGMDPKLILLRQKLAQKAKKEPKFKFYSLYSLVYRTDVLEAAWMLVKKNQGSPGIDNVTVKDVEQCSGGTRQFLLDIQTELQNKTYKPQAIRRVYIPKADGGQRPLGIPTIKDRVVQMSVTLILEPIFETDFLPCSFGFRPGISAHDGIQEIVGEIKQGRTTIYDADMKGYFDSIPHDKLMACVRMRVTDSSVNNLIRMWLKAPIVESDEDKGQGSTITHPKRGIPQGGVISPLLANLYLHWFDVIFHRKNGPREKINARLIRYADDFVVLMRYRSIQTEEFIRSTLEDWMGLTLNKVKTRIVNLKEEGSSIDFLGFNLRFAQSQYGNLQYLKVQPKKQAFEKAKDRIRSIINFRNNCRPIKEIVDAANSFLNGWSDYFQLGNPYDTFAKMDHFAGMRMYRHLRRRSQRGYNKGGDQTWYRAIQGLGLIRLTSRSKALRKAVCGKSARTV